MVDSDLRSAERDALVRLNTASMPITSTSTKPADDDRTLHEIRWPHLCCRVTGGWSARRSHAALRGRRLLRICCLRSPGRSSTFSMQQSGRQVLRERAARASSFFAAAKVGGILANDTYPAEFLRDNLVLQTNVIEASRQAGVKSPALPRLIVHLSQACSAAYLRSRALLTGPLEPTNRAYALAKIAGIEMCWSVQPAVRYAIPCCHADESLWARRQL